MVILLKHVRYVSVPLKPPKGSPSFLELNPSFFCVSYTSDLISYASDLISYALQQVHFPTARPPCCSCKVPSAYLPLGFEMAGSLPGMVFSLLPTQLAPSLQIQRSAQMSPYQCDLTLTILYKVVSPPRNPKPP